MKRVYRLISFIIDQSNTAMVLLWQQALLSHFIPVICSVILLFIRDLDLLILFKQSRIDCHFTILLDICSHLTDYLFIISSEIGSHLTDYLFTISSCIGSHLTDYLFTISSCIGSHLTDYLYISEIFCIILLYYIILLYLNIYPAFIRNSFFGG